MKFRKFGRLGWSVSEIGFGGWGIGARWWGSTDDETSKKALRSAAKSGINFFDTAYVYGDGHSEELIGEVITEPRAIVATKIPPKDQQWPATPDSKIQDAYPADWIVSCTERSLKKLRRDTIDLTQFHTWTDAWIDQDEWKEAVTRLRQSGKIRGFGVSINDHEPNSALKLVASGLIDSVQVIFNIFDQSPREKLFPLCLKHNVAVIVRVPFDEGGLTGQLTKDTKFEDGDFRKSYFRGDNLLKTVERAEKLKSLLGKEAATLPELALKFVLAEPAVSTVIAGMRKPHHVAANTAVADQSPLSAGTIEKLKAHAWQRNFYGMWDE